MTLAIKISFVELLIETVLGFVFWSLFEGLAPMIWFYPLNELEISGYEAFAICFLSPLLYVWPLKPVIKNKWVVMLLRVGCIVGLGSFQAQSTLQRLMILSFGVSCVMLVQCNGLWHVSPKQRCVTFWGMILGKFAMLAARIWATSFVPTWWSNTSNSAVIAIASVATFNKILSGHDTLPLIKESSKDVKAEKMPSSILTALGAGSLLFTTSNVFSEVSIITRWTVRGFPETGPMPYPWGFPVLVALWLGFAMSPCRHVTMSVTWWLIGTLSFGALYFLNTWPAYIGGVILAVYVMSIWPEMVDRMTSCSPALTFGVTALLYVVEVLFYVWTVAYNFVPGGVYTREHTDWLIGFIMLTICLAIFIPRRNLSDQSNTSFIQTADEKMPNSSVHILLLLIMCAGFGGFAYRYPRQNFSHPEIKHPKADFTAAIWTYHFGYDNKGWPSLERSAELLNNTGADVITLLESDASKSFLGNNDLGMWLGERLGMYVDFGVSTKDHTWGNLLLSKYPIVKSKPLLLPSPYGELAPGITATVNMSGHLVDFVVTHMGNDRDNIDRKLQADVLATELRTAENPVVFLGYVTSAPFSRDYNTLTKKGNVKDIDHTDSDRWCEYIMYRGLQRQGYARVSHGGLSDTEVQMARFRIPVDSHHFTDNDQVETDHSKVTEAFRFNSVFGSYRDFHNWRNKHEFHMSTPKYFKPDVN